MEINNQQLRSTALNSQVLHPSIFLVPEQINQNFSRIKPSNLQLRSINKNSEEKNNWISQNFFIKIKSIRGVLLCFLFAKPYSPALPQDLFLLFLPETKHLYMAITFFLCHNKFSFWGIAHTSSFAIISKKDCRLYIWEELALHLSAVCYI